MWRYQKRLQSLYETPRALTYSDADQARIDAMTEMIIDVRNQGRVNLTEFESKQILAAYGIPIVETHLAQNADEAIAIAENIGYPVVLKVNSQFVANKSRIGGVRLDLATPNEVRHAYLTMEEKVTAEFGPDYFAGVSVQPMLNLNRGYELIMGASPDLQFGPVLMLGTGGTLIEIFQDRVIGFPPLTTTLARRMMERIKIYKALAGIPGHDPVDLTKVEDVLVRFSHLVVDQTWLETIDINPLFVSSEGVMVLDAKMRLYDHDMTEDELPQLAIRPYPTQYIQPYTSKTETNYTIRPISPEDEPKIVDFHGTLSERSIYLRYFRSFNLERRTEHERLARICFIDYDREMVLVAEHQDEETGEEKIVGVGRLTRANIENEAEYAVMVSDDFSRARVRYKTA